MTTKSGRSNLPQLSPSPWPTLSCQYLFSRRIVALTAAIAEDPWLVGSRMASQGGLWRTVPIPDGGGIVEYVIDEAAHRVILTRIFPFT
jgi:hypothetical protein